MSYIGTDLDCFDLWIEYGFIAMRSYLRRWDEFHRLHGD